MKNQLLQYGNTLHSRWNLNTIIVRLISTLDMTCVYNVILIITFFISFFVHSMQCTLNLLTQVNNNLYKYLCLAEIPVSKTGLPGVKNHCKGYLRGPFPAEVCRGCKRFHYYNYKVFVLMNKALIRSCSSPTFCNINKSWPSANKC